MYVVKPLPLSMWFNESFQSLRHFANKDRLVLARTLTSRSFAFCYTRNQPVGQNRALSCLQTYAFQQYALCYEFVTHLVISKPRWAYLGRQNPTALKPEPPPTIHPANRSSGASGVSISAFQNPLRESMSRKLDSPKR